MASDKRLDEIVNKFDELFKKEEFNKGDELLRSANIEGLDTDELLSFLTATLPAKSKLPYRPTFYALAELAIKRRGDYQECLLLGLE